MKKITLMLLAGITMYSTAHSQNPTSASATALTAAQISTQQFSVQRQAPPQSPLSIFPNFGWTNKPALPGGRWATGPVFSKNCISGTDTGFIYLIAGYDASFANTAVNTVYNTATGAYRTLAPIPAVRGQVTPVKVGSKIYVIGGYGATSFSPVNTNSIYDIATNTWTTGAGMPVAVGDYALGVYKDSLIYFVGGYNGSADVNNVQIYNTFSNTWSVGTPIIGTAVAGCRMGISGNNIVFVGGYSQTLAAELANAYQGVINAASPTTITWTALPNYPGGTVGRLAGGVCFENTGSIYFGGGDPTGQGISTLNTVFAYNTTTSTWDSGPNMPVSVSNIVSLAGIVNNDSLYLVTMGGYDGSVITTTHSWLNLGHAAPLPTVQAGVSICTGTSTTLTASNALTYSWSPATNLSSTTTASTTANPTSTITYSVTMTKVYGCPITAPVTVTVNPLPTVTANSTASTVCAGNSITLTGGGAVSYTWNNSVTDGVSFVPASTLNYMVTGTDANGCVNTATATVTVNPLPVVTANSTSSVICAGTSVMLTGGGAVSYTWNNSVTDGVSFVPASTLNYMVTGTDANGCINTATTTVTVNPLPVTTTTATDALCNGSADGTAMTMVSGSSTYNYSWSNAATTSSISGLVAGTYTVTVTDNVTGCTTQDMATVNEPTVITPVVLNDTTWLCNGVLTANVTGGTPGYTYLWTPGGQTTQTATNLCAGTYTCTVTDANGCTAATTADVVVNLGIASASTASSVSVYPNPTNGSATINGNFSKSGIVSINLFNMLGESIMVIENNAAIGVYSKTIDLNNLSSGVYYLQVIENGNVTSTLKVVKQ